MSPSSSLLPATRRGATPRHFPGRLAGGHRSGLNDASASIATALRPAGLENSAGVISTSFLKDVNDPAWKDDQAMKDWLLFIDKYYPGGDKDDGAALYGYASAETLVQVLKQCGDD